MAQECLCQSGETCLILGYVCDIFVRLLKLSPLTNLLDCFRTHPWFDFGGTIVVLALPSLCRVTTNEILRQGLARYIPALGRGFLTYISTKSEPTSDKRYVARFLLNLLISHCYFAPDKELSSTPDLHHLGSTTPSGLPPPAHTEEEDKAKQERKARYRTDIRNFYAIMSALFRLRGPLGATHVSQIPGLLDRDERFLGAANLDRAVLTDAGRDVAAGLELLPL